MASASDPSSLPRSTSFHNALVTVDSSSRRHSAPSRARLTISSRIYWTDADQDEPASSSDFRRGNSLELSRFSDDKSWDSVRQVVSFLENENGRSVVVRGKLHVPVRRQRWCKNVNVKLVLMADTAGQAKKWLNEIRMLVAPADLLHQQFLACVRSMDSNAPLDDVKERLEVFLVRNGGLHMEDLEQDGGESPSHDVDNTSKLEEGLDQLNLVDKATAQTAKLAGSIGTAVKIGAQEVTDNSQLVSRANEVAEIAQEAADVTGAIDGLSCAFQLFGLGAKFAAKIADVSHGSRVLPKLLDEVVGYLGIIMTSLAEILRPRMNAEKILVANMFMELTRTIDAMGAIEEYVLEGKVGQPWIRN